MDEKLQATITQAIRERLPEQVGSVLQERLDVSGVTYGTRLPACKEAVEIARLYREAEKMLNCQVNRIVRAQVVNLDRFLDGLRKLHPEFDGWQIVYNHIGDTLSAHCPTDEITALYNDIDLEK